MMAMKDRGMAEWLAPSNSLNEHQFVAATDNTPSQMVPTHSEDIDMEQEECPEMYKEGSQYFAVQMSAEQHRIQGDTYTKAAVKALVRSAEYLRRHTRCTVCWSIWSENMTTASCLECGGYAMERPCPVCEGRCGQVWKRDVELSHSNNEAHWQGTCALPEDQKQQFLASILIEEADEESVLGGMEQLCT